MNRFAFCLFTVTVLASALGLSYTATAAAQTPGLTDHPAWESAGDQGAESSADEPATIAERLFVALLDRFPSALENEQAAQQIDNGQLDVFVGTLLDNFPTLDHNDLIRIHDRI